MLRNLNVPYAILAGAFLVLPAILGCERPPSAEELARQALEGSSPGEQEVAAVRLAELGTEAKEHLQRVLAESQSPAVRAACIRGLAAQRDYDSMPVFLDALDDESELVRGRAGVAVQDLLGADFGYRHNALPKQRKAKIQQLRQEWERMKDTEAIQQWKGRQQPKP